jgi:hypothetical protein
MNQRLQKLGNPYFLFSLLLLIFNDFVFKYCFHNTITGKLSDFAGLFAFPFLISTLFPNQIKGIHFCTFLVFIFWKSELSQPFINLINYKIVLINRVIDYSDYIAMISIWLSFKTFNSKKFLYLKPIFLNCLLVISCFAFLATSMPRHLYNANKKYDFNFSKEELVKRINKLQIENLSYYINLNEKIVFDSIKNIYLNRNTNDTILFIIDFKKVKDNDTIHIRSPFANVQISGNDSTSSLKLINLLAYGQKRRKAKSELFSIESFERNTIEKIKSPKSF